MVTTVSARAALAFALDLQRALYEYDWDWDRCDEFYQRTTLAFVPAEDAAAFDDYRAQAGLGLAGRECVLHAVHDDMIAVCCTALHYCIALRCSQCRSELQICQHCTENCNVLYNTVHVMV